MDIRLPSDCGNAPRIGIVSDFVVGWASGDLDVVAEWLSDDVIWDAVGRETFQGADSAKLMTPSFQPQLIEVRSVVTHGRLASCDGYFESDKERVDFSHALRFASTAKTAKLSELRTYMISTDAR